MADAHRRHPGDAVGCVLDRLDRAVAHRDPARQRRGQLAIVGDDQDRSTFGMQLAEQVHHGSAGSRVEVAGRLVGQHDRRAVDDRPGDGDALTLATRHLARACASGAGRARRGAVPRPRRRAARATACRGTADRWRRCRSRVIPSSRKNDWKTNPIRCDRTPESWRSLISRCVDAGDADDAAGRPIERADDVQQRRLARARGADDCGQLAVSHLERHRIECPHRWLARRTP